MLWMPNPIVAAAGTGQAQIRPGNFGLPLVARVKPGVAREQLVAQLDLIAKRLPEQYGGTPAYAQIIDRFTSLVVPLREQLLGSLAGPLWILLGATGILLLIACANVANYSSRVREARRADVAIRRAIGAPRWNLVGRQLSKRRSWRCSQACSRSAWRRAAADHRLASPVGGAAVEQRGTVPATIVFTLAVSVVAGLVCGVVPAARTAGVT